MTLCSVIWREEVGPTEGHCEKYLEGLCGLSGKGGNEPGTS